jgi:putative endonuclease
MITKTGQPKAEKWHYVYILLCADDTLYTGWTLDMSYRIDLHNAGKGAKYTKPRLPVKPVYWEAFATKQEAMKRECQIKSLTRAKKLKLIEDGHLPSAPTFP